MGAATPPTFLVIHILSAEYTLNMLLAIRKRFFISFIVVDLFMLRDAALV